MHGCLPLTEFGGGLRQEVVVERKEGSLTLCSSKGDTKPGGRGGKASRESPPSRKVGVKSSPTHDVWLLYQTVLGSAPTHIVSMMVTVEFNFQDVLPSIAVKRKARPARVTRPQSARIGYRSRENERGTAVYQETTRSF